MNAPSSTLETTVSTSPAARSLPYATLLAFTRYVGRSGPAKATFVSGLRRQRESGRGFNPHSSMVKALKADIQFRTDGSHLAQVAVTVNPHWHKLYASLTEGATRYLRSLGDPARFWLTPTREALGMLGDLPVRISAHFGLRYEDGRVEAVRLHFDEEPPTPDLVTATLHLMSTTMEQILPHGEPVLVDVRRGATHRMEPGRTTPNDINRWLTGEAAAFTTTWTAP